MTVNVGLLLTTLAVACSCGSTQVAPSAWGPLAMIDPEPPFHLGAALATGTIRITEDCVLLDEGAREVVLIWMAKRTTWKAADRSVTFSNIDGSAVEFGDGDQAELGGAGESAEEGDLQEVAWLAPPSPSCPPMSGSRSAESKPFPSSALRLKPGGPRRRHTNLLQARR